MKTSIYQFISTSLHVGLAGVIMVYKPAPKVINHRQRIQFELIDTTPSEGQVPKPIVNRSKAIPKKIVKKMKAKVKNKASLPQQKVVVKVITQKQESPVQAAVANLSSDHLVDEKPTLGLEDIGVKEAIRDARKLSQKTGNKQPAYPLRDRYRKSQGKVTLLGYINHSGSVEKIRLESSTGTADMNKSALKAFSNYKFEEGQKGWVRMPFHFLLKGQTQKIHSSRDSSRRHR